MVEYAHWSMVEYEHWSMVEYEHWSMVEYEHWSMVEYEHWSMVEYEHWSMVEYEHRLRAAHRLHTSITEVLFSFCVLYESKTMNARLLGACCSTGVGTFILFVVIERVHELAGEGVRGGGRARGARHLV